VSTRLSILLTVFFPLFALAEDSVEALSAIQLSESAAEYQLLSAATHALILPAYQDLDNRSQALAKASSSFCQQTSPDELAGPRQAWLSAMASWSAVAGIGFGPIDEANSAWHFQFWPDPINLVHRKFKSRIKGINKDISADELAGASVAIQGLSAMEYLLFDAKVAMSENYVSRPHYCILLQETAKNLAINAHTLNIAWQSDYHIRWLDLARENAKAAYFLRNVESLFSGMVMAIDVIKDKKLGGPLGYKVGKNSRGKTNTKLLESWRSQSSLENIRSTLTFSQRLYNMDHGLGWYMKARSPKSEGLDQRIRKSFKDAIDHVDALGAPALKLLKNKQSSALDALYQSIKHLQQVLKIDYAKEANILYRFNARDGD
jgi:predicted lipoprotein